MRERAIVLVVDDEPEVCTSLKRLLESAGLEGSLAHLIHILKAIGALVPRTRRRRHKKYPSPQGRQ